MSVVDWINGRIARRSERIRPTIVGDSIRIDGTVLSLKDVAGIVAYDTDVHAGTVATLALAFAADRTVVIGADDECWPALVAALDQLGLTDRPSQEWMTSLIADGPDAAPQVLRRP